MPTFYCFLIKFSYCMVQNVVRALMFPYSILILELLLVISFTHNVFASEKRTFVEGESIEASDLLPIAERLLSKVEVPGFGKGIVSSTRSPKELAHKLFADFFMTSDSIVTLKDPAVSGLSALQELAFKPDEAYTPHSNSKRRAFEIAKKLAKKRRLQVNMRRYEEAQRENESELKERKGTVNPSRDGVKESRCNWRYDCWNKTNIDTCKLITNCNTETSTTKKLDAKARRRNEHVLALRRRLGLTLIDEEVAKILSKYHMLVKGENNNYVNEKFKLILKRFEGIMDRFGGSTTVSLFKQN